MSFKTGHYKHSAESIAKQKAACARRSPEQKAALSEKLSRLQRVAPPTGVALALMIKAYSGGKSIAKAGALVGASYSVARRALIEAGVTLRSMKEAAVFIDWANRPINHKGTKRTPEQRERSRQARLAWSALHAKGVSVKKSGYVEYTTGPHKGRSVHVVMMEERLGRHLRPDECVHHIDDDGTRNTWDNLALVTRSGHARLHRLLDTHLRKRTTNGRFA